MTRKDERPYFEFGLPAYHMFRFACAIKYFIHYRELKRPALASLRAFTLKPEQQELVDYDMSAPPPKPEKDKAVIESDGEYDDMPPLVRTDSSVGLDQLFGGDTDSDDQKTQDMLADLDEITVDSTSTNADNNKRRRLE